MGEVYWFAASGRCAVVEQSPHDLKIEGSKTTANGTWREELVKNVTDFCV